MGTITDATDPVDAALDILRWAERDPDGVFLAGFSESELGLGSDDTIGLSSETVSYYPDGENPARIEADEDSDPSEKQTANRRGQLSVYVGQDAQGNLSKFSAADDLDATYAVSIEVWHGNGATAYEYYRAIMKLFGQFGTDNRQRTPFVDIFPDTDEDFRGGNFSVANYAVYRLTVLFREYDDLVIEA